RGRRPRRTGGAAGAAGQGPAGAGRGGDAALPEPPAGGAAAGGGPAGEAAMIYHVRHTTTYDYSEPVALCHNLVHLTARSTPQQTCLSSLLEVQPEPAVVCDVRDYFDNHASFFTVQEPHHRLTVTAENVTRVLPPAAPAPDDTPPWEAVRDLLARERA